MKAWHSWSSSCTPSTETGSCRKQPFTAIAGGSYSHGYTDEDLAILDNLISKLFASDDLVIGVIHSYYIQQFSYRELVKLLNKINELKRANGKPYNYSYVKSIHDNAVKVLCDKINVKSIH